MQQEASPTVQRPAAPQPQPSPLPAQSPAPSAAHSAAAAAVVGVPTPQALQPAEQQTAQQQEEQAAAAVAAEAAAAAAAKGFPQQGACPASVAPAQERRLSGVPTPAVVTEARAAEARGFAGQDGFSVMQGLRY